MRKLVTRLATALLIGGAIAAATIAISSSARAQDASGGEQDADEGGPVITPADGPSNFEKASAAIQNAMGVVQDATADKPEAPMTEQERAELEQQAQDAEHPMGHPDGYGGAYEPLPRGNEGDGGGEGGGGGGG